MKGLFSKIMNKINELPNPPGIKITNSNQNQNKIPASNSPTVKPSESPNTLIKNNQINDQQNNNTNNNVNTVNNASEQKNNKKKVDQIVMVNERQIENKVQGYYYKKHIEDIRKLKISEPIIYQRQKMKVNFDIDILDYLFNDMTEIFKQKSDVVEENKNELIKKINETYELVNILNDINKNSDDCLNKYMKEKKIMDDVEILEIFVKTLSQEVDDLLSDIAKFEQKMKNEITDENKK
jgi:hypothetical protein